MIAMTFQFNSSRIVEDIYSSFATKEFAHTHKILIQMANLIDQCTYI